MTVGERIKKRRIELDLTQEELAKKMGYSDKSTICKAETCGDDITTRKVKKYADALNCSFEYLMGWDADSIDGGSQILLEVREETDRMEKHILEYSRRIAELDLTPEELEIVYKYAEFLSKERK